MMVQPRLRRPGQRKEKQASTRKTRREEDRADATLSASRDGRVAGC